MKTKRRRLFWLCLTPGLLAEERVALLHQKGYEVFLCYSLAELRTALKRQRAGILVVSSEGEVPLSSIQALAGVIDLQGMRIIFSLSSQDDAISYSCAIANARDLIPIQLEVKQWLSRFLFATSAQATRYSSPAGQLTLKNISAVQLPARITHLDENHVRVECRIRATKSAKLNLSGPLAEAMGASTLSLKVVETQRQNLLYRFSDAFVAEWSVQTVRQKQAEEVLTALRLGGHKRRLRTFVAVQSNELREKICGHLNDDRCTLVLALQRHAISEEPRFYSPELAVIESSLVSGEHFPRLQAMLKVLPDQAQVILLGPLHEAEAVAAAHPRLKIVTWPLSRMDAKPNPFDALLAKVQSKIEVQADLPGLHIQPEHDFSKAQVIMPARLVCIHPLAASISVLYPISNFALLRIDSPLISKLTKRRPYLKATATYVDQHPDAAPFVHRIDGYWADLDPSRRVNLASGLARLASSALLQSVAGEHVDTEKLDASNKPRSSELGSIRLIDSTSQSPSPPTPSRHVSAPSSQAAQVALANDIPSLKSILGIAEAAEPGIEPDLLFAPLDAGTFAGQILGENGSVELGSLQQGDAAELLRLPLTEQGVSPDADDTYTYKPKKRKPKHSLFDKETVATLGLIAKFLFIGGILLGAFWMLATYIAPHWHRSGGVYSDQLKRFGGQQE